MPHSAHRTAHPRASTGLRVLYRAASGQDRFETALAALVGPLKETIIGAQMIGLDPATGGLTFSHANLVEAKARDADADADLEYLRKYHAVDPRIPLLITREPSLRHFGGPPRVQWYPGELRSNPGASALKGLRPLLVNPAH